MWGQVQKVGQAAPGPSPSYLFLLFVFFCAHAQGCSLLCLRTNLSLKQSSVI